MEIMVMDMEILTETEMAKLGIMAQVIIMIIGILDVAHQIMEEDTMVRVILETVDTEITMDLI